MNETAKVWVSTTSHRSRERLARAAGDPGPEYGSWPEGKWPAGSYYEVPDIPAIRQIPGVRVLRKPPPGLFQRWTFRDGPEPGNWPVPAA